MTLPAIWWVALGSMLAGVALGFVMIAIGRSKIH
jgi:hypothetical protein